jgi:predicted helicase
LEAFDPELRKALGVWYTSPEIVQYQVARVDTALREELGIPDGLADPRVFVLDPCSGTGTYIVEVLRKIVQTLKEEKGEGALAELAAKEAAMNRVFGFEIMPAPFVVAHLQLGLLLQSLGVPLDESKNERAGIFLTNALTGWDFAGENPKLANWPELEAERKGAGKVKQEKPILVLLGNPPYNAYAGISPEEEQGLVEPYKTGLVKEWGIRKFNLDDLYVRFFRLAERRIAEKTGRGIVCYISNFSYLSDPSFVVMRQRFLKEFDTLWFDCLNGDSRETGKLTPEGKPDPSVFSTEYNREGIRVGTAIGLMVRRPKRAKKPQVFFRQFWGADKRSEILKSLKAKTFAKQYEKVAPEQSNRFTFCPQTVAGNYLSWPKLRELCGNQPLQGMDEDRANSLIEIEKGELASRMEKYFDGRVEWDEFESLQTGLSRKSAAFEPEKVRKTAQQEDEFATQNLRRYLFRPYDIRWCYYTPVPNVWKRSRPELWKQSWEGNAFLLSRAAGVADPEGIPFVFTRNLLARDCMRGHAVAFPLRLRAAPSEKPKKDDGNGEFGSILHEAAPAYKAGGDKTTANLSPAARAYLAKLGIKNPDADAETAALLWMHALAIGYSPAYLAENADGVRQDWPRIPLPSSKAALLASAELGKQVAALLDTETSVEGVANGKLRAELKTIAVLSSTLNLSLTAGWGHAGQGGVTMPGKGKLETRGYTAGELEGRAGSPLPAATHDNERRARSDAPYLELLGHATHDVFLNNAACWRNVPEKVWDYTIGGYQVIKKWLSYREFELLGRALTPDEAREVTHMARRIAALILLQPELDKNYQRVKAATFDWKP